MQFDHNILKKEIDELAFVSPDPLDRLNKILEIYNHYKGNEPANGTFDEKEEWFKCMTLLESNKVQLEAICKNKHPDDYINSEQENRESDGLPKYEIPDYKIVDDYKECVFESALEKNKGDDIARWLQDFLSEHFYIPNAEIQIPILSAFILMNSLAAPSNEKYPRLWIWGSSGTGKTRISEMIKYFYGGEESRRVGYSFGTQTTAAAIRNTLDPLGRTTEPTLFHWENVTPNDLMNKLKEAYTILLTNTRGSANKGNMIGTKEGGVQEFKLHTLWVVDSTQTWGNQGKEAEVRRRCIFIKTEKSEKTYQELSNWSWKKAPSLHHALWSKESIEKSFYPLLMQCKKLSLNEGFPFKGSDYQPYYQLIASGVHTKVWSSVEEALEVCLKHKDLHESKVIEGMPLKVIVETIINRQIKKHKYQTGYLGFDVTPVENALRIPVLHPVYGLKVKIEEIRGSISAYDLESKVCEIMNNLGYRYEVDPRTSEQVYIKDSLD